MLLLFSCALSMTVMSGHGTLFICFRE